MTSQAASAKGMSLYANLLEPSESPSQTGTISRAPVVFKQATEPDPEQDDTAAKKQQISAASLRFQPTKRPQLPSQKFKTKPGIISKPPVIGNSASPAQAAVSEQEPSSFVPAASRSATKSTLADWTATQDDYDVNGFYGTEKRQRGGRKKRKKNRDAGVIAQNWDDIYDPSRPNSYDEYKHSDEKIREVREWKDRLYAHRMARRTSSEMESDDDYSRIRTNKQFAPQQFAPPPMINKPPIQPQGHQDSFSQPIPTPASEVPDDPTGDDAYARRLRMSQNTNQATSVGQPQSPPRPAPAAPVEIAPVSRTYSAATISRPAVRYTLPPAPEDIPATETELEATFAEEKETVEQEPNEDAPRSLRPGQKGFAERLLTKYGWTKGSGLGAGQTGIVNPLQVKIEKQKKRPDSEGGGFVNKGGRAKIIGGNRKHADEEGKFGAMTEVIILHGMVDGMDLEAELESGELMQEIGEECGEKYGRVERVFIDRNGEGKYPVFVKFTNQLSALRAVNALEGRVFNGNTITARFFNTEKFEEGVYS